MQIWVVCNGFNQLVCVCLWARKEKLGRDVQHTFNSSSWEEKLSCRHGERERNTLMTVFFYRHGKKKSLMMLFLLFVDDISLKTDNEAPQRGATTAKRIQALLLLLSLLLVPSKNVVHDNLTWTDLRLLTVQRLVIYIRTESAKREQTLNRWYRSLLI